MKLRTRRRVTCAFGLLSLEAGVAHGSDAGGSLAKFSLEIDRQPLDGALQQLAKQCDLQVVYFSRVTEGIAAPAIRGQYTLDAAMHQLLAGSRLTFRVIDAKTVEVRPFQARPKEILPAPEQPAAERPGDGVLEEVVVVGLAEQLVATRIATPLREIPQSVSIVTRDQSRQQNTIDLGEVLSHVPGITTTRSGTLSQEFLSRGYVITSLHVDGGAALDPTLGGTAPSAVLSADLNEFDHVEVLRGSDALFTGNGNPGGTLSLVRKQPQRSFTLETNVTMGSWEKRRFEVDVTGPIALDGALRARADVVYASKDFFYDSASVERSKVFAALAWDITPDATLIAGGSYQSDDAVPSETGLPYYTDGRDARLPRDTSFVFDWQEQRTHTTETYLQFRQAFTDDWNLKLNVARWHTRGSQAVGFFGGRINPETHRVNGPQFLITNSPMDLAQTTADATLTGVLDWFGRRQEIAIGGDTTWTKSTFSRADYRPNPPLADVRRFDPAAYPDPRPLRIPVFESDTDSRRDQYGAFASMRVYFDDAWSAVAGARIAGFSMNDDTLGIFNGTTPSPVSTHHGESGVVTPYAGLMYDANEYYTLYASYADIYGDSSRYHRLDGRRTGVQHGVTLEAGVKAQWREGALYGSLAMYRVEQNNSTYTLTRPIPGVPIDGPCCVVTEDSWSRGVDLEINGEVRTGWSFGLGYSYNENERTGGRQFSPVTPKHLLKAWTNAELAGAWSRWSVGGSLHAQSRTAFDFFGGGRGHRDSYVVLDLRAGVDIDSNWQATLSVNNVLDKIYYESIGEPSFTNWYGEPRNLTLRIDGRY